jgi:hypothetical protein
MSIFSRLFGGVDKGALTRELLKLRIRIDPNSVRMGVSESMADSLSGAQLAGAPEASIVAIVQSYVLSKKHGGSDAEIFRSIESHRSLLFPRSTMPSPLNLKSYIKHRISIEHPTAIGMTDAFVESAIEISRKAFEG